MDRTVRSGPPSFRMLLVLGALAMAPWAAWAGTAADQAALRKALPIQLYMRTCVLARGNARTLADAVKQLGFKKAPDSQASYLLSGHGGQAWVLHDVHGNFEITALDNGLCSLFVHQGKAERLRAMMEAWLPPKGVPFTYKKQVVSRSGDSLTTAYKLYLSGKAIEEWVITTSSDSGSKVKAIMSYDHT